MTAVEISEISSSVVALVAIGGLVVAGLGLKAWRKQLRGTTEYELAKRLLLHVYKVRDAIGYVRQPFLSVSEAGEPEEGVPWEVSAYNNRWKGVRESMIDFEAAALEGEVVWGKEIIGLRDKLKKQVATLNKAVSSHLRAQQDKRYEDDFTAKMSAILYSGYPGDKSDDYDSTLDDVINKFETYLRPHLGHN